MTTGSNKRNIIASSGGRASLVVSYEDRSWNPDVVSGGSRGDAISGDPSASEHSTGDDSAGDDSFDDYSAGNESASDDSASDDSVVSNHDEEWNQTPPQFNKPVPVTSLRGNIFDGDSGVKERN